MKTRFEMNANEIVQAIIKYLVKRGNIQDGDATVQTQLLRNNTNGEVTAVVDHKPE